MEKEFESIIKAVKNIKLSDAEKGEMRASVFENLSLRVEQNDVVTNQKSNRLIEYYQIIKNYYFMNNKYKLVPVMVMVLIVVLAGGTSAFAEKAVPGDLLYGVKVSVNEPIAGIFAVTKEEKVEWQERLVERRLVEAQKLVAQNNLKENTRAYLESKIQNQVAEFSAGSNDLASLGGGSASSSDDLNIRLQASLKAYSNVLAVVSNDKNTKDETKQEMGKLLAVLSDSQNKIKDNYNKLESKDNKETQTFSAAGTDTSNASDSSLAETKQNEATNLLNSIKLTYQKEKNGLSVNIQDKINGKLAQVETTIEEGKTLLASSDYANATDKFQLAIDQANTTKLLMLSNSIKGDIEDDMGIENEDSGDIEEDDFGNVNNNIKIDSKINGPKINIQDDEGFDD